jgi:hypothetical protein
LSAASDHDSTPAMVSCPPLLVHSPSRLRRASLVPVVPGRNGHGRAVETRPEGPIAGLCIGQCDGVRRRSSGHASEKARDYRVLAANPGCPR